MKPIMEAILLSLVLSGCGTYTPSAHRQDDASTGSLLPGVDAGANGNGSVSDPSIREDTGVGIRSGGM